PSVQITKKSQCSDLTTFRSSMHAIRTFLRDLEFGISLGFGVWDLFKMPALWIKGARVIDPAGKRDAIGDLFIDGGRIVAPLPVPRRKRAKQIDARGLIACPGL